MTLTPFSLPFSLTPFSPFSRRACLRLLYVLACAVAWTGGIGQLRAANPQVPIAEAVRVLMEKRTFEVASFWPGGSTNFCEQFLRDFRAQRRVRYATPLIEAEAYEALASESLPSGCRPEDLFDTYSCDPKLADSIADLPANERKSFRQRACRQFRGTQKLRVYQANMDDNPSNGDELISSFQRIKGPVNHPDRPQVLGNGGYKLLGHSGCEVLSEMEAHDPYDYFTKTEAQNYSGLIEYKKRFYVFDLYALGAKPTGAGAAPYSLTLSQYVYVKSEGRRRFGPMCVFQEGTGQTADR